MFHFPFAACSSFGVFNECSLLVIITLADGSLNPPRFPFAQANGQMTKWKMENVCGCAIMPAAFRSKGLKRSRHSYFVEN